ncbi:MAG: hypothetical protein GY903_31885 [Fuerstiella sp.]|nr:hypothetical protein [Fuerstiella sp.]MCP4859093.1 hypothetical protein [Fuerstiella sp.]
MNDLTERHLCVPRWPQRLIAISVLSVAAATTGCSVFAPFTSGSCSCRDDGCGEGIDSCTAGMPCEAYSSQDIQYPQSLPMVSNNPMPAPAPASRSGQWAPRHDYMAQAANASCENQLQEARQDFDNKLASLESRFEKEHRANDAINDQLQVLHGDVLRLSDDVEYWENEVRRIDRTAEVNHNSEMENLRSMSELIDQIVPDTEPRE